MVLAATPNQHSSGLIRRCSTATIDNDIMALMLCPSDLSALTLMGYLYAYKYISKAPITMTRVDVVLAATPNQHSSGLIRRCSTATIDGFDAMSFCTIHANFDEILLCLQCYIACAIYDEEGRCGAGGHPKSSLIRTATRL